MDRYRRGEYKRCARQLHEAREDLEAIAQLGVSGSVACGLFAAVAVPLMVDTAGRIPHLFGQCSLLNQEASRSPTKEVQALYNTAYRGVVQDVMFDSGVIAAWLGFVVASAYLARKACTWYRRSQRVAHVERRIRNYVKRSEQGESTLN